MRAQPSRRPCVLAAQGPVGIRLSGISPSSCKKTNLISGFPSKNRLLAARAPGWRIVDGLRRAAHLKRARRQRDVARCLPTPQVTDRRGVSLSVHHVRRCLRQDDKGTGHLSSGRAASCKTALMCVVFALPSFRRGFREEDVLRASGAFQLHGIGASENSPLFAASC